MYNYNLYRTVHIMIKLSDVSLYYYPSQKRILHDISWHIKPGEQWVLFGRNGSGKTRLLEIISGYSYPSTGSITRFGKSSGYDVRDMRTQVGIVNTLLRDKFPINEEIIDVVLSGIFASIGLFTAVSTGQKNRATDLLESLNMADDAHKNFHVLSDGEKQKVLMLRALINSPSLLVLDEPCMALDIGAREDLLENIEKLISNQNITTIYVTHHIEEILPVFTKMFILKDGACFDQGDVSSILTSSILKSIFNKKIELVSLQGRFYSVITS